jgi:hypothetical protein
MNRTAIIAGVAVIALTNAVALGGVAWNRSGEPESVLELTERELMRPYGSFFDRERGGVELVLNWRVLPDDPGMGLYVSNYGSPDWFDEAKLQELGFNVTRSRTPDRRGRYYERHLPREALIVLEFDGPTYPKAVERVRKAADKELAAAAGKPGEELRAKNVAETIKREETGGSRLFAVDVGLDAAALRAKYPDRTRYAIVTGKVRASQNIKGDRLQGYIAEIHNTRVNVPREMSPPGATPFRRFSSPSGPEETKRLPSAIRHLPGATASAVGPAYQATIAFGKRYEPWLLGVRTGGEFRGGRPEGMTPR